MTDKELETELRNRLHRSEAVDSSSLSQLQQARQQALASLRQQEEVRLRFGQWQGWLLAASLAAIAVLVAMPGRIQQGLDSESVMALEDGPQEDVELYQNLEFYQWLLTQEDMG